LDKLSEIGKQQMTIGIIKKELSTTKLFLVQVSIFSVLVGDTVDESIEKLFAKFVA